MVLDARRALILRVGPGALLAAASALTYGSLGVFAKLAYAEGWNVPSLLAARFLFAGLTVLPFALRPRGGWSGMVPAFALGAIGYASTTALYFPSIRLLPAALASFLLYLAPVLVALLSWLLLRERLGARGWGALAIAVLGLALLSAGALGGTLSRVGILLAAGSAVSYAITTLVSRNVAQRMHWARLSLGVCAGALASYLVFSAATRQLVVPASPLGATWALGLGVVATGIPLALFFAALARAPASQVSVISTLEPVSTLLLAALFLAEIPGWAGIVGGLLIVVAAAIIMRQEPITAPHE